MSRITQKTLKKQWIARAQGDHCLLCSFPLLLGSHLHHIVAYDDQGPGHVLNLVALCPNHHLVVECVRRHIEPNDMRGTNGWLVRARAAMDFLDPLPTRERRIFDALAKPHRFRNDIRKHDELPVELRPLFARDLAREDARMLLAVHRERPELFATLREASTKSASRSNRGALEPIEAPDFAEVIQFHLELLGLPFEVEWLGN